MAAPNRLSRNARRSQSGSLDPAPCSCRARAHPTQEAARWGEAEPKMSTMSFRVAAAQGAFFGAGIPQMAADMTVMQNSRNVMMCTMVQYRHQLPIW